MNVTMGRHIYQLRITLDAVTPPVWRRLLVPAGYTLDRIHRAIQYAMGWQNCHLHSFEVDGEQYGEPDPIDEMAIRDELDYRLDAVATKGTRLRYTYDFGDWWDHTVLVEDVLPADPDARYPYCSDGARACPPEDVGGPDGYERFLAAIADPAHDEHAAMTEWAGRTVDPEEFDPDRVSTLLRRMV
jgi:hypothetical protein